ncbi:hypothetical protein [Magnetococcus sp. PR-3]|uniref:hypothetical protein n=1 Tax=Magnetococcus sp. PR-3 TaxID=3120355 RepID=UPI003FA5BAEE
MMREFLDLDVHEICQQTGLNTNHCYVVLHRARVKLRGCLDESWFSGERASC